MLSVLMDVFVVLLVLLDILLLSMRPSVGESRDMKFVGIGGSCGAEEPGVGNIKISFSSIVMLLVSFGSGRWGLAAVLGGGGSGGSCVGLPPGFDCRIDFLVIMEPPDLDRRCPAVLGDGSAGKMPRSFSGLRGIGRGRFRTDFDDRSSPLASLMIPSTASGSSYTISLTNMMVCCFWVSALASTSTSLALSAIALGFPGRPFVGLRCRAVFTGSGGGVLGEGASCLEGRIVTRRKPLSCTSGSATGGMAGTATGTAIGTATGAATGAATGIAIEMTASAAVSVGEGRGSSIGTKGGDSGRGGRGGAHPDGFASWISAGGCRGDRPRSSSPPGDSIADEVSALGLRAISVGRSGGCDPTDASSFRRKLTARLAPSSDETPGG